MKTTLNISMVITLAISIVFSVIFAYSNVDNTGLATLLFLAMTAGFSTLIAWGYRELYRLYENRRNNINTLKEEIANVRDNIESTLLAMLKSRNITEVDCGGFNSTPVISSDTGMVTLDVIELCNINGNEYILFNGCGEYENYYIPLKSMDIEYLIGVYEWAMENQEELFEVEEDE